MLIYDKHRILCGCEQIKNVVSELSTFFSSKIIVNNCTILVCHTLMLVDNLGLGHIKGLTVCALMYLIVSCKVTAILCHYKFGIMFIPMQWISVERYLKMFRACHS